MQNSNWCENLKFYLLAFFPLLLHMDFSRASMQSDADFSHWKNVALFRLLFFQILS